MWDNDGKDGMVSNHGMSGFDDATQVQLMVMELSTVEAKLDCKRI